MLPLMRKSKYANRDAFNLQQAETDNPGGVFRGTRQKARTGRGRRLLAGQQVGEAVDGMGHPQPAPAAGRGVAVP